MVDAQGTEPCGGAAASLLRREPRHRERAAGASSRWSGPAAASTTPTTAPKATWSAHCGRCGNARMAGARRATAPRSTAAMATPATAPDTAPPGRVRDLGRTAASTAVHTAVIAAWATSPGTRPPRRRKPGTNVPAARAASSGSRPVASAHAVDGAPLTTPPATPALTTAARDRRGTSANVPSGAIRRARRPLGPCGIAGSPGAWARRRTGPSAGVVLAGYPRGLASRAARARAAGVDLAGLPPQSGGWARKLQRVRPLAGRGPRAGCGYGELETVAAAPGERRPVGLPTGRVGRQPRSRRSTPATSTHPW